jgi:D-glycero-D-manno-heptose 1,7-bisphosphate phosphatase
VTRPAVFLDRDGTIVRDNHYMGRPEQLELLPGAAGAIARLNRAGWPVIVVTNQSGIARGYFTTADYDRVRAKLDELLAAHSARVDASYMCPHHPEISGPCECRKPGTLLYRQASKEHGLDPAASWYIGDRLRDVLPAAELGGSGRGMLIPNEGTSADDIQRARADFGVAATLDEAVSRVLESAT